MHKKHTLLFLICGMSFAWLFAGNDSFQMSLDNFPNLKQIPSNSVRRVFQDSEGYMWFGTLDGVCRYDGYNLKLFRSDFNTPNLLVHNEIFAISEDLQGRMWIGTKAGLNILDKRTMEITQYPDSMLYNEYVIALTCDAKGNMWIGTRNGLFRHDRKTNSLISYQNKLPVISVNSIYQDLDGKIWVMFWANGLYQYLPDTDSFVAFPRVGEHNNPFRLLQDKDKNYWLGTWSDGLFAFNPAEKKYTIPTFVGNGAGSCFFSIVQDDVYGYIWAMSMSGLHVLAPVGKDKRATTVRSVDISDYHFPTTTLSEIIKDRNNCLWVGTFSEKAFVINLNKPEVKTYLLESLTKRINQPFRIIDIEEDSEGVLWLALDRQGGCLFNPKDNSCTLFSDIPALRLSKSTRSITYIKSLDEYWLVDYSTQIERVKKKNGKITYAGSVFLGTNEEGDKSIGEDAFGNVFIATEHELLMRKENGQISTVANFPSSILDFTFDKFGKTWVVTEKDGIYLFQRAKNGNYTPSVRYGKNTEVLATDDIRTVCAAADGLMWIGTREGRIITKQPQSENFIDLTTLCAMNGEYILDILEDKMGQIWISSYNKIIKYNPTTKTATIYTESDGINTNSFLENASFSSPSGKMFFGGDKGLCEFEPVAINKQKNVGKVLITDVKVNNQPAKITEKGLKISYSDKNIEIYFSSLDYTSVSRIQYAYKLEGVDKEWIYVNNRNYATYNNLKTGEYIFQVKATNPNGVWDETVTTFTIVKAPAFYETWWMILLYIVVLMVIIYFSYRYVFDRISLQNSLKIAEIEKQSAEQLIQTKLRYFTNISHEFLTPLTIINCVVEDIPASFGDAAGVKSIIKANVSRLQRLLQQILDFRKVESGNMKLKIAQGDIVDFVQDICYQNFMPLIKEKNINFEFKIIIDGKEIIGDYSKSPNRHSEWTMIYFDADKIDKILFNLLSNAFKYTPQKGKISVIVEVLEQTIRISVTDTGKGIPATELPNIFNRFYNNKMANFGKSNGIGLSLTKELVELHHGHISVTSVLRQGATFVFEIPSKETAYIAEDFVVQINNKSVAGVVTGEPENEPEDAEDIGTPSTLEDLDDLDGLLIVEDNKELRDLLEKKFSQHYHTYIAENGQQALEIIKNEIINIVVSDVMMPQMDGLELCKRIKNDLSTSHIEVILLTAKNTEDDRIASYEAGADAYIAKPFEMKVLEARISNMVKKRQQRLTNFQTNPEVRISDMQYQSLDSDFLQKTIKIIEEHLDNSDFNIGQYAETLHMSRVTFYRKIKSLTGLSAVEFVRNVRLKHACEMLKNNSGNISEIAYAVGFQDPRYFSTIFKKEFGISPKQYK